MANYRCQLALIIALATTIGNIKAAPEISSAQLPLEARNGGDSMEDEDVIATSYVLPNQIFNDGKPYYASKDPISGQLDFSAKKTLGIETAVNEVIDPKEKIVLSSNAPNIHDYLNLPVKYSSSKFVYPLVSSSYANLKYQGSNKNYITNKKPTSVVATPVTPLPSPNYYTVQTTKLMAVPPTAPGLQSNSAASSSTGTSPSISAATNASTITTTTTTSSTSKQPSSSSATYSSTLPSSTTTRKSTAATTPIPNSSKYATPPRKSVIPFGSTSVPYQVTDNTTRKKFIPTKKYTTTTTSTSSTVTVSKPVRFPDQAPHKATTTTKPTATSITSYTTHTTLTNGSTTTSNKPTYISSTKQPILFTEDPNGQLTSALPLPVSSNVPELNIADVYQTLGQKKSEQKNEKKPTMSLADIFNSLAEDESVVASHNQGSQGFDPQGNYMQPISLSKPAPFATQQQQPVHLSTRPSYPARYTHEYATIGTTTTTQPGSSSNKEQNVISGSQENYSGEYVSYQVQQPNVMQYRPAPGTINNVVISPGQHSASFVLGSQQQVGNAAYGSVQKEPLFSKDSPVQYGTVISEDISALNRPSNHVAQSETISNLNYQQNDNSYGVSNNGVGVGVVAGAGADAVAGLTPPYAQNSQATSAPAASYPEEEPPAPPSPYQQLPLIGSNMRPRKPSTKPHALPQTALNNYQSAAAAAAATQSHTPSGQILTSTERSNATNTKEMLVSTNIRFPSKEEQNEQFNEEHSVPVAIGPPAGPQINGHAQPLSLQQLQSSNNVVFPKVGEDGANNDIQIQKHEVLTMNQHKQKLTFPTSQQESQNAPSQHMEPPPRYPTAISNAIPENSEIHKRPQPPNRPHGGPPSSYAYNEFTRKPLPGLARPNSDRHLPNILPQFRPNAKISSGHPNAQNFNQEPGNIRIPPGHYSKRLNGSPQFAHRRQPLMQPQHRYPLNRATDFGPGANTLMADANRRLYRLPPPPYSGPGLQYLDRIHPRRPLPSAAQSIADKYERHAAATNSDGYKAILAPERLAAFEEDDLVINDPPKPLTTGQEEQLVDNTKLEPVVTLQMLQSQKKQLPLPSDDIGAGEIQVTAASEQLATQIESAAAQNGLYLVYPSRGDGGVNADQKAAGELKKEQPVIANVEAPTGSDYQNTPFTVMRDQPQEPILKNKKPQSLQQQTKTHLVKDKFPYPIEKPDLSYAKLNTPAKGHAIGPRIISGLYASGVSDTPIAIAYSPTEPSPYRRMGSHTAQRFSNVNLASSVISEIRSDTQTEEGISNDFDVRAQNLEKNFMAPFYPSVSLGAATNAPSNGWNIFHSTTKTPEIYRKNNINRADVEGGSGPDDLLVELTTTKTNFETDNFQPEMQGGFKPIYPPGYTIEAEAAQDTKEIFTNKNENEQQENDENDKPLALASHMRPEGEEINDSLPAATIPSTIPPSSSTASSIKIVASAPTSATSKPKDTNISTKLTNTVQLNAFESNKTENAAPPEAMSVSTTTSPDASPTKKNNSFETSLAALLFGDDDEFEVEGDEARKQPKFQTTLETKAISAGPRAGAPRMGPRSLKLR